VGATAAILPTEMMMVSFSGELSDVD